MILKPVNIGKSTGKSNKAHNVAQNTDYAIFFKLIGLTYKQSYK